MPWPLEAAEAEIELNDLPAAYGIELPHTPPLLHYSRELVVYLWSLERCGASCRSLRQPGCAPQKLFSSLLFASPAGSRDPKRQNLVTSLFCREKPWKTLKARQHLSAVHLRELAGPARLTLAKMGARLALAARNEAKLEAVAAEITAAGGQAKAFLMDVSDEASIQATAKAAIAHFGSVEILVNNAGITRDTLLLRMKRADWDAVMTTNLTGAFLLTQAVLNPMLRARWGRIINISSVVGRVGQAGQANYAASKAGLIGFTLSMARELAPRSITVNAVAPGYIETAMTAVLDAKQRDALLSHIPLGRPGSDRGCSPCSGFSRLPTGRIYHRARARRKRRPVHELSSASSLVNHRRYKIPISEKYERATEENSC